MNSDEFILQLENEYGDFTAIQSQHITDWIDENNLGQLELRQLFKYIIRNNKWKTIKLAHIIECWEKIRFNVVKFDPNIGSDEWIWRNYGGNSALSICEAIWKLRQQEDLNSAQISFMHAFDDLYHIAGILKDKNWSKDEMRSYLEKVKESVCSGERVYDFAIEEKPNQIGEVDLTIFEVKNE